MLQSTPFYVFGLFFLPLFCCLYLIAALIHCQPQENPQKQQKINLYYSNSEANATTMPATDSANSSSSASTSTTNHQQSAENVVDPNKADGSWFGRMFTSNLEKTNSSSDKIDKSNYTRKHTVGEIKPIHQDFNAPKEGCPAKARASPLRPTRPMR
jgi:hypothetical protein